VDLELLGAGLAADVYVLDQRRVLRRYRREHDVSTEIAIMKHVRAQGFPAPEVFGGQGADLEMERLFGPTMAQALRSNILDPAGAAHTIADLHERLHALPPMSSGHRATRVIHLDLHPANVILTEAGPAVIDWTNATEGSPDLDLAMTALIMAQFALTAEPPVLEVATVFVRAFRDRVGPLLAMTEAVAYRAKDPNTTAEQAQRLSEAAALATGD
jgi:aminoglycoside phosphotransferase (APT) family kinase protein